MRTLALLLGILAVCGCSAFSKDYPDKRYFALDVERPGEPQERNDAIAMKVRLFEASRRYEDQELVYRQGEFDWASDYYHALFITPADTLTEAAIKWLGRSGRFGQVVPQTSRLQATHYLEGYLSSFYGDYSEPGNFRAVVELAVLVIDERDLKASVAHQQRYRREEPLSDDSVEELILGFDRAITSILTELENDLSTRVR